MPVSLTPTQSDIQTALRSFLLAILPAGIEVIAGLSNRVPEPEGDNFVVFTPILRNRLSTNVDAYVDATFTGSISGNTLTITEVNKGALVLLGPVYGANVAAGTIITAFGSGSIGGVGTYTVNNAQTVAPGLIASGSANMVQPTQLTFQIDAHGPLSADFAQTISTLFRDEYAVEQFAELNAAICPLYAGDPRQMPFTNAEDQIELRWVFDAVLQVNQAVVVTGQQFASQIEITPTPVAP